MYKRILGSTALVLGMAAAAPPQAQAQWMPCGTRDSMVAKLGEKYGETKQGAGLSGSVAVVELYASEKTGTWTILRTDTRGLSCVMAVGEGWESEAPATKVDGDPV